MVNKNLNKNFTYTINPCYSVNNFIKQNNLGPNTTNNLCYQVCNDWLGESGTVEGSECYNNCKNCMLPFIKARGKDICSLDFKVPPIWKDIPSFYPEEFRKTNDKLIAYKKCKDKCKVHCKNNLIECNNLCKLDMDALIINDKDYNVQGGDIETSTIKYFLLSNPYLYIILIIIFIISLGVFLAR